MQTNIEVQNIKPQVFNSKIAHKAVGKFFDNMSAQDAINDIEVLLVSTLDSDDYTSKETLQFLWTVKQVKKLLRKLDKSFDRKASRSLSLEKLNNPLN